jgi:regulator of replication initiation timing
LSDALIS